MNDINKYNAIFNELQRKVDNGELTLERAEQINDMAYELYTEAFEGDLKINKLLGDCKTEYHNNIKDIKKAIKAGNISIAKRNIQSAKKNLIEAKKIVDKIPVDANDNIMGYLVETANAFVKVTLADALIVGVVTGALTAIGVSKTVKYLKDHDMDLDAMGMSAKKVKGTMASTGIGAASLGAVGAATNNIEKKLAVTATAAALATLIRYNKGKDVNFYKSYAKKQIDRCIKHLDKLDKKLDKKAFKESCEYDESSSNDLFIDQVFDCYLEDVITDDEFLSIMESYNEDI